MSLSTKSTNEAPEENENNSKSNSNSNSSSNSNINDNGEEKDDDYMWFGKFRISPSHIFYRSNSTAAIVNLRPIVPGHVLVIPKRVVPLLQDLTEEEHDDLWRSVRKVQAMLRSHIIMNNNSNNNNNNNNNDSPIQNDATSSSSLSSSLAFNVAVQDGYSAGQSVPHIHVHILPRQEGDFERNDDVYDEIHEWSPLPRKNNNAKPKLHVPDDEDRKDRTPEQMAEEAASYRAYFNNN